MNTATICFFTVPLKKFLDRAFSAAFFAPPIDFVLAQKFSLERSREFNRYMQPNDNNDRYCQRLAIRESFSTAL